MNKLLITQQEMTSNWRQIDVEIIVSILIRYQFDDSFLAR